MFDQKLFGQRLLKLRTARGEKQPVLSRLLGVSVTQISEMETGKKGTTLARLALICQHYHVSADYLLGLTDDPEPVGRKEQDG